MWTLEMKIKNGVSYLLVGREQKKKRQKANYLKK